LRFGAAANNIAKTTSRHGEKFEKRASEKLVWRRNVADKKSRQTRPFANRHHGERYIRNQNNERKPTFLVSWKVFLKLKKARSLVNKQRLITANAVLRIRDPVLFYLRDPDPG
jgi:hypothetical protein